MDNGTVGQFGAEIELRAKLEQHISTLTPDGISQIGNGHAQHAGSKIDIEVKSDLDQEKSTTQNTGIPTICLVLEGGPNTLETAAQSIAKGTPVVVIEGSGRAADFIA